MICDKCEIKVLKKILNWSGQLTNCLYEGCDNQNKCNVKDFLSKIMSILSAKPLNRSTFED